MAKGVIKRYDFRKGFGFIADEESGGDFFFHKSEWQGDGPIRKGITVTFVGKESEKGPHAESVTPADGGNSKPSDSNKASANNKPAKPAAKSAALEDRIEALESAVGAWKIVSLIGLAGVIALAIANFLL